MFDGSLWNRLGLTQPLLRFEVGLGEAGKVPIGSARIWIAQFGRTLFFGTVLRPTSMLRRWTIVLIWMALIFSASGDRSSFQHSSRYLEPLLRWLFPHLPDPQMEKAVFFVRKCAHFGEYAILAILVWRALHKARTAEGQAQGWDWKTAWLTLALVIAYAISDEVHQHFVPSRQASVVDVFIDSAGACSGLACVWVVRRLRYRS